jgi:hypothetical protein
MKIRMILVLVLILAVSSNAIAQSEYLDRGQSGGMVWGGMAFPEDASAISGGVKYCVGGKIDLGFGIGKYSFDDSDDSITTFSPSLSVEVLEPTAAMPLGVQLSCNLDYGTYSSTVFDDLGWDMTSKGIEIGAKAYMRFISGNIELYPFFGIYQYNYEITIEDSFGTSDSDDGDEGYVQVGMSMLMNKNLVVAGGMIMADSENTAVVSAGILF